jgi:hypothetical protein
MLGNAWLFHDRDKKIAQVATVTQANVQVQAAATACSTSVDALAKDSTARADRLEKLINGSSGVIVGLQQQANQALAARPSDPADLCKSLAVYLRDELHKERATEQAAAASTAPANNTKAAP